MSGDGYTYTTISAGPGEPTHITVSFYLDDAAWITVYGAGKGRPQLGIAHGEVSVNIAPRAEGIGTAEDVRIARTLADKAAAYAAEVERLAASTDAGPAAA